MYKMRGKIFLLFFFAILLIGIASAANYCCEKTTSGAFCQNVNNLSQCDNNYKSLSTFCSSTSFCADGTCINQQEGTCIPSTQSACENNNGFWSSQPKTSLPQCQLGCCLIGDQAAFVTQVACNRMSVLYGLDVNYQANINDELTCLASANPQAKGACVYTKNYVNTCEMTTKKDCQTMSQSSAAGNVSFHEGYLCSAQELGTVCGKTQKTTCGDDDKVYFVDSCGNKANIYDASKVNDESYWTKIQNPTCDDGNGNKDSATCGVCDYYSGSMCQQKKTGDTVSYGDNLCKNLDCKDYRGPYEGSPTGFATAANYPKHGETWCSTDSKTGVNSPGADSFKMMCYNGEVTPQECDSTSGTRQEICVQNYTLTSNNQKFYNANCKANIWQDCWQQSTQESCEDPSTRDCQWISSGGYNFTNDGQGMIQTGSSGVCVPAYQPGFERGTASDSNVQKDCAIASSVCYVMMEKPLLGNWQCASDFSLLGWKGKNNCSCLDAGWQSQLNGICNKLGDCGIKQNYFGILGSSQNQIAIKVGSTS